jgi:hypothetical protein
MADYHPEDCGCEKCLPRAEKTAKRAELAEMLWMKAALPMMDWPNCSVPDCQFKACLSLHSDKCYPHTTGDFTHLRDYEITRRAQ